MSRSSRDRRTGRHRRKLSGFYLLAVVAFGVAALPWLAHGLVGALGSNSNDPRQWLPRGFDETETYHWLQAHFGRDEITVVSWPGCTLDDPRTEQLARALLRAPQTAYFQRALTGQQILQQLVSAPLDLPRSEALRRLQGVLIGSDGKTTCVVLTVSARGEADRAAAVEQIRQVAQQQCGIAPGQLRLGGPTVDAATIDVESQRLLLQLAGLSALVSFAITWLRLRSPRLAIIILVTAVYSTALAMAILYYTGGHMNLVMTMLPPLIYVLSISAAVHLVNYYRDALKEGSGDDAPVRALACGWWPCTLASGTTAVGLLSLAVSEIVPVKMFGVYAAAGMCASLVVVLLFVPVALTLWPAASRCGASPRRGTPAKSNADRLVDLIGRRHGVITAGCLLLMVVTACGLPLLRSTVKLQYRFGSHSRIIEDYRWLEAHLGPLVPMEVVVHFDAASHATFLDQLEYVAGMERNLERLPDVGAALSGASFAPILPTGGSLRDVSRRAMLRRNAATLRQGIREAHYLADGDAGEQLWRISLRAPALSDVDYGRFVETLRRSIEPGIECAAGVRVTYTGVIPLIYKAQRELLSDLVESFFLAFALIALVMILVLRDPRAGLLAMVPNVFPAVVIFGLMGLLGVPIEIGSIMTASAAMGIAVDDTFHFLSWFRSGASYAVPRQETLRFAFHRCAGAMVHTTLICACGLLVFSLSSFMPIVRFSWMMTTLLLAALLGDLILLPALLAGPLGTFFSPRRQRRGTADPQRASVG
jgi:predicted RND superfamily exporter protein